jgi:hypothetical protein
MQPPFSRRHLALVLAAQTALLAGQPSPELHTGAARASGRELPSNRARSE